MGLSLETESGAQESRPCRAPSAIMGAELHTEGYGRHATG
jgi:hypothetical protein